MSYMFSEAIARNARTLSTVSTQMGLGVEAQISRPHDERNDGKVWPSGTSLVFGVAAKERVATAPAVAHSLRWALRCRLPLSVAVGNARSDVLALLTEGMRSQMTELSVEVDAVAECMPESLAACDGRCGAFLCALSTFPHVTKLSLLCGKVDDDARAAVCVQRALRVAAQMPISVIEIEGFVQLRDFSALAQSQLLRSLAATRCGIQSVGDLVSCPMLTDLKVSENQLPRTLSGLAGVPCLHILNESSCSLQALNGLGSCPRFSILDESDNEL
ncbi:hypothetical protein ABL78_0950 [Leptomonas seymouri]|uniref:Leucine-rich repeat protein (LRRP) n=1 Tax=Leptomonas seymouri TaxID=5684 RepID=A0A0N1I809_LEPSE|nr:hypothetical protein ABL78_0950 [Leptomonas seymouri]|eukprot:KPI89878.1 hypothetical protein ABL78_0950 [Leptomonas seymouri]